MLSGHSCIRVHKIGLPLLEAGHDVHLVARRQVPFNSYYKTWCHYADIGQFVESIKLHPDAELFHVHNEPSWFVSAAKEQFPHKPVILDVHDSFLTRTTPEQYDEALSNGLPHVRITTEERNNFQLADALVFVSDEVRSAVISEFDLKQPAITLPSYVPANLYQYHTKEWLGGLVYEGRITLPEEHQTLNLNTGANYCDYRQVGEKAAELGMDFHLYAGRDDEKVKAVYGEIALVHPGYEYRNLLKQISRHDWGLVGNLVDSPQWQQTLSNKMFDYVASCVPVVAINAKASSQFISDSGIGITVSSLGELCERWPEHRGCRANLIKNRKALTMESHIDGLLKLYRSML